MKSFIVYLVAALLFVDCSDSHRGELIFVEPEPEDVFQYPYFLFIPDEVSAGEEVFVIVEPNNSGFADDDLQKHMDKAENTATNDYYLGNYVAQQLKYPLLVPAFPRPQSDWRIYTHALDRDVMLQKCNSLERIDLQILAMFEDARVRLQDKNIESEDSFLLTGFSASGTFANRFTLMHPERVKAVAAGGLNGLLILPLDSLQNELLNYPVGTGDMQGIAHKEFQEQLFLDTPQFYFMGQLDDNDAVPYDDAFDQVEREQIYRLLGEQMLLERWDNCRKIYENSGVNADIRTYEEVGHKHPDAIKAEIMAFFREAIRTTDPPGVS